MKSEQSAASRIDNAIDSLLNSKQETFKVTEKNIQDIGFFETTRNLYLQDGSDIKKGSQFIVENKQDNGEFEVHFSVDERNKYHNEFGDGYFFSVSDINHFAKPTEEGLKQYEERQKKQAEWGRLEMLQAEKEWQEEQKYYEGMNL